MQGPVFRSGGQVKGCGWLRCGTQLGLGKEDLGDGHRCSRGRGRCPDGLVAVGLVVSNSQVSLRGVREVRQHTECPVPQVCACQANAHPGVGSAYVPSRCEWLSHPPTLCSQDTSSLKSSQIAPVCTGLFSPESAPLRCVGHHPSQLG